MTCMTVSRLAAAAMLLVALAAPTAARAQARSIELDQALLDKWLVVLPAILKLSKSAPSPQTDDEMRPHLERICAEAGFPSYEKCGEVIGYVGMIVSACDRRSQSFRDPIPLMRRQLARLEADAKMPPEAKARAIADVKGILAEFPDGFPRDHIALANANRDRIFAALIAPKE